jgi:uncharacterized phage protein (TIGR01671 family)
MKREIKFRAWDKVEEEMVLGDTAIFWLSQGIDEIEFMQFTGLRDKNDKEIWEGDIVKCGYGVGKVVFKSGCFWAEWIDDKEAYMEWIHSRKGTYIRTEDEQFEVIGNIFENPQLLTT